MSILHKYSARSVIQQLHRFTQWMDGYFYFFRSLSVILAGVAAVRFIELWPMVMKLESVGMLGGLLFGALYIANVALLVQLIWARAGEFRHIPHDHYEYLHIGAKITKMTGEFFGIAIGIYSIASGLLFWFAGGSAWRIARSVWTGYSLIPTSENYFIQGGSVMVLGTIYALGIFVSSAMASQILNVLAEMAKKLHAVPQSENFKDAA